MWILSRHQTKWTQRQSRSQLELLVLDRTVALQNLSQRLLKVQDEERRRVARDLHDSTGQTLTALRMNVAFLQEQLERGQCTREVVSNIAALADQALQRFAPRHTCCIRHCWMRQVSLPPHTGLSTVSPSGAALR